MIASVYRVGAPSRGRRISLVRLAALGLLAGTALAGGAGGPDRASAQDLPAFVHGYAKADYAREYRRSWFLGRVHAAGADALGFTGRGVTVAVVDSGLDLDHPEFAGRISPDFRSFELGAVPGQMSVIGRDGGISGHGTHVAGIVGAARDGFGTRGVAPESTILPLRAIDIPAPSVADPTVAAIRYATRRGAQVLNGSYGPPALPPPVIGTGSGGYRLNPHYREMPFTPVLFDSLVGEYKALKAAAEADVVLVYAAGNEFLSQPTYARNPSGAGFLPIIRPENHANGTYRFVTDLTDLYDPATYQYLDPSDPKVATLDFSDLEGALITVVATGRDNRIADYSNRCGLAYLWCLAAPGGNYAKPGQDEEKTYVRSTWPYGTYKAIAGTSMASPVVAGGAAVLRQAFPYLTARQVIEIILTTTDRIGPAEIYGRGLFNLGRAARGPKAFGAEGFDPVFAVHTRGTDSTWSNDIVGAGGLVKRGAGDLVLSGANTYAGGTQVRGGTLTLDGSLASAVAVGPGGGLLGTGRIAAPLQVAGTIEPGREDGVGTLHVRGDVALARTATLSVDAKARGRSDRLVVSGATALSGTLAVALMNGLTPVGAQVEILSSEGGITGRFTSVRTDAGSAFLAPKVSYAPETVTVRFARNAVPFASVATTPESKGAARALDAGAGRLHDAVLPLGAGAAARAFGTLTGAVHGSAAVAAATSARRLQDILLGHLHADASPPAAPASVPSAFAADRPDVAPTVSVPVPVLDPRRFALWGEGFGAWGRIRGDAGPGLETSTGGFLFGAEIRPEPAYRIGIAGGSVRTAFDVSGNPSSGATESVFGAVYGAARWGGFGLRGGAAYAVNAFATRRTVAFPGFTDRLRASYDGAAAQAFAEIGYRFDVAPRVQVEPVAGASWLGLHTDGFTERGGPAALTGRSRNHGLGATTLGVRAEARPFDQMPLTVRGLVGWRHTIGDLQPASVLSFGAGGRRFTAAGVALDRDAVVAEAGLAWQATSGLGVGVSYAGQVGSRVRDHALKGDLTWRF